MAEIQNPVELPKEDAVPAAAVVEATATEATEAPALATEDKTTEDAQVVEGAETKTEDKPAEEIKPVEEGHLGHKAQGASFPKNLIPSKEFFFFGTDAVEPKALSAYLRSEKNTEHAHHNISWASHTGNGLLFIGDKSAPSNVINLADTTEPETDGATKFHFTHKGAKHSFKAANAAERDSWVAQLKIKIVEAKEIASSVTESEAYKNALEGLKPAVKEEVPAEETQAEETPKTEETAAAAEGDAAATEEAPVEEPKRRSISRKRVSLFGFGRKESSKKEETPAAAEVDAIVPAAEPAAEAVKAEETPAVEGETAATEEKAAEEEKVETPKPLASKRNSFFGAVFAKKEKKVVDAKPTEEVADESAETTDAAAPVIPPVESTTPINAEEVNAAGDNTETAAAEPAAKKDVKEKRKSSLPFAFGRREKSPSPAEGEEKRQTQSPFSKLRATIKSKTAGKAEEKPVEEAVKEETEAVETAAPVVAEEAVVAEPAVAEAEDKAENVAAAAPAVTASA